MLDDTAEDIVTEWHQRFAHDMPDTNIKPSHLKTLLLGIQAFIQEPYQQVCPIEEAIKLLSSDLEMVAAMVEEHHFLDQWLLIQIIQKYPDWKRQWNLTAGTYLKEARGAILMIVQQLTNNTSDTDLLEPSETKPVKPIIKVSNVHEVPFRRWVSDDGSVNENPSKRKKSSHPSNLTTKKLHLVVHSRC